ncbi:MAG TPA: class I SAM-dependent methyltransferase, partial [Anaerolineae bacterium]|nr:class I SAM-dependent methyltransferase [Anaerolineae bacterium]
MTNRLNNFFEEGSPFLNHPLLTAERTAVETNFLESQLRLPPGARILDVGCGFGRHSIELARRGYTVTGIDPAAAMIAAAQERAKEAAVSVDFRQARGEEFTTAVPFDAAICLFTSLGQMGPDGDNSALVSRVYDALKPGGLFVVEVPQRDTAVTQLRPSDKFGDGERYTA